MQLGCLGKIGDASTAQAGSCGGQLGATPMRRLTSFEYNATVADLLGDTTHPADAFPPDEIRAGFDNNSGVVASSPALIEAYMNAAEGMAARALVTPQKFLSCDPTKLANTAAEDACASAFVQSFGKRAYRRPPSSDEAALLMSVFHAGRQTGDFVNGIRLAMETILQSPRFLYRVEIALPASDSTSRIAPLDSYEMATRLSYLIWSTMPDDTLLAAADAGALTSGDQIRAQVKRMLADPRAHAAVAHFDEQWLKLAKMDTMVKDPKTFPNFTPAVIPLMQKEARQFLDDVMWNGDLTTLLTASHSYMNADLARYYGVSGPTGSDFVRVDLDPTQRAGVLTLGGVMSMLSHADQTSPVHRGRFVREQLLCGMMPNPPPNVPKLPDVSPTATTRERLSQHSTDPVCHSCHRLMDPIGFTFEKIDGAGMWRTMESGQPIDDSGTVEDSDITGTFNGPAALGAKLAKSLYTQKCVVTSWFHYAYARLEAPEDMCTVKSLVQRYAASGQRFSDLLLALTETDAFRYRNVGGAP